MQFVKLYLVTLPVFFAIDMLWLGVIARNFYRENIGFIMAPSVNWFAAISFYLLFIGGLVVFVITPAAEKSSWIHALTYGALFCAFNYGNIRSDQSRDAEGLAVDP